MNIKEYRLTDICDFQGGTQPPKKEWSKVQKPGYVRMLQIRDFTQNRAEDIEYVKDNKRLKKCDSDDILIGRYGASVGKILTGFAGTYNVAIVKTIPDKNILTKKYLYRILKGSRFQSFIQNVGARAAQAGFNKSDLSRFKIKAPSIENQIRIATLLSHVETLIAKRKESIRLLDELLKSTFLEMFGDPVKNEKGWEKKNLKNVSIRFSDGPFGSNLKTKHYSKSGIRVIRLNNIGVNKFLDTDIAYIKRDHYNKVLKKYTCYPNDIVIATMGNPNIRACLIPKYIERAVNKADCVLCRPNEDTVNKWYLVNLINLPAFLFLVAKYFHGQTRTRVSMGQLAKLYVPIPPLPIQGQFAQIAKKTESLN